MDAPSMSLQSYENCFRVRQKLPKTVKSKAGKKKPIRGMSASARRNFIFQLNQLGNETEAFFVTLTVQNWVDDFRLWKKQLNRTLVGLRYHFPLVSGYWRLEFQKRGAPHFHLLLFPQAGMLQKETETILKRYWLAALQDSSPALEANAVDVKHCRNVRKSAFYLALYQAKTDQDRTDIPTGRLWGVIGKKHLPTAQYTEKPHTSDFQAIWLKRLYRRYQRAHGVRRGRTSRKSAKKAKRQKKVNSLVRSLKGPHLGFSGFMPRKYQRSMFSCVRQMDKGSHPASQYYERQKIFQQVADLGSVFKDVATALLAWGIIKQFYQRAIDGTKSS